MTFDPDSLYERLRVLTDGKLPGRWLVGYSGGIDSTVLLHALAGATRPADIVAIHINHGLHAEADQWEAHCRETAHALQVGYECRSVAIDVRTDHGPEAAARRARYDAFLPFVREGDCLLSAHHENDQAETLLLNLLRGSGPAGLAGIGLRQSFGRGTLLRPMLGVSGDAIAQYARDHDLRWIEDPTNADARFDRNFLRSEILPRLAARWPAVSNRLRRSAELVAESSELLNDLADIDLQRLGEPARLSITGLQHLPPARQRNVLRRAVRLCGLPTPPATRLYQVIQELIPARVDAQPLVSWAGASVRRYREHLYVMPEMSLEPADAAGGMLLEGTAVTLGNGLGRLLMTRHDGDGIDPRLAGEGLRIQFRRGGEAIRTEHKGRTRKLKKLLQEEGIVPWMRPHVPLLFAGDRLVAVADLWLAADAITNPGLTVAWLDRPPLR